MDRLPTWTLALLGLGLLAVAASGFVSPRSSHAQHPAPAAALEAGLGGMWVLSGDTLRVCMAPPQTGLRPATPVCGDAISLR